MRKNFWSRYFEVYRNLSNHRLLHFVNQIVSGEPEARSSVQSAKNFIIRLFSQFTRLFPPNFAQRACGDAGAVQTAVQGAQRRRLPAQDGHGRVRRSQRSTVGNENGQTGSVATGEERDVIRFFYPLKRIHRGTRMCMVAHAYVSIC